MTDTKTDETKTDTSVIEKFGIHGYKPTPELHYDDEVKALIAAEPSFTDGEVPAYTLNTPTKEVAKAKRHFQESAKANGRTARAVSTKDNEDGNTRIEFVLRPKVERPRKAKDDGAAEDATPEVSDKAA